MLGRERERERELFLSENLSFVHFMNWILWWHVLLLWLFAMNFWILLQEIIIICESWKCWKSGGESSGSNGGMFAGIMKQLYFK